MNCIEFVQSRAGYKSDVYFKWYVTDQWGSRISQRGAPIPEGAPTYYLANFFRKLPPFRSATADDNLNLVNPQIYKFHWLFTFTK